MEWTVYRSTSWGAGGVAVAIFNLFILFFALNKSPLCEKSIRWQQQQRYSPTTVHSPAIHSVTANLQRGDDDDDNDDYDDDDDK